MSLYLGENLISGQTTLVGESRNIGQIIPSAIPLTDAGLHLLDGALIQGSGIYSAFVTYITGLVSTYPDLFTTEANWQQSVTTYGVCGKFVCDSVNNTVRLPKITGIIEGTIDVTALGDLVEAGLPNIEGRLACYDNFEIASATGPFYALPNTAGGPTAEGGGTAVDLGFDASRANSIYGRSNTVQPQTIKCYYYIVIATSTKTDIEVDIDEVATDLNGKADVDLTNVPDSKAILQESYVNGTSWYRIYSDGWCEQGGATADNATAPITVTLLKAYTNNLYSVQITINGTASNASNNNYPYMALAKTNSTFKLCNYNSGSDSNNYYQWEACGYIN